MLEASKHKVAEYQLQIDQRESEINVLKKEGEQMEDDLKMARL